MNFSITLFSLIFFVLNDGFKVLGNALRLGFVFLKF